MVKRLMGIHTMVPIMVLRLIRAEGSFVAEDVEYHGINGFQILLKSFLESVIDTLPADHLEILGHTVDVNNLLGVLSVRHHFGTRISQSGQIGWIVQYRRNWWRWIISSLFFINGTQKFKKIWYEALKYWRSSFGL